MRRIALTIVGLATAGLCTLSLAHSANAADGVLVIGHRVYPHPSGCYEGTHRPLVINNHTNQFAYVFEGPRCEGRPVGAVAPGDSGVRDGLSVLIS
jgi:hypothetical protein